MAYRKKMSRSKDRKSFSRTASKTHAKNVTGAGLKRGGIRL